jgi:hypothetical protein
MNITELTQEQRDQIVAEELSKSNEKGDYVFSNPKNCDLTIPDLGTKGGRGGEFIEVCTFHPYQTRKLSDVYEKTDIDHSSYLRSAVSSGQLIRGGLTEADKIKNEDPLTVLCRNTTTGEIVDPLSGTSATEPGTRYFDRKLKELFDKEEAEDKVSRKV